MDQSWGLPWDDMLPYVAMSYRISKQKSTGYSPDFLLYGRDPLFPSRIQQLEKEKLADIGREKMLSLQVAKRGAVLKEMMQRETSQ